MNYEYTYIIQYQKVYIVSNKEGISSGQNVAAEDLHNIS